MTGLSPSTMTLLMGVLAVFAVGGLLMAVFYPRLSGGSKSQKRLNTVAGRSKRTATERSAVADEGRRRKTVEDTLKELEETQKAKLKKSQRPSLNIRLHQAGLSWSKNTYWMICAGTGVVVAGLVFFFIHLSILPSLGFGVAGGLLLTHMFVNFTRKRRFKKFSQEFPNAVDVIVRGVKAGLPLIDCLKVIAGESQEPVKSEFRQIVEDQTLGLPLADAVSKLPERIPLAESNFFAIVIAIQSKTGGSLSESLNNLSKVLRDRKKLMGKIKSMSQEAKSSAGIIGSLPILVSIFVYITSPAYILLLFQTTVGNIVLAGSLFWMFLGIMVMRKMINFDY